MNNSTKKILLVFCLSIIGFCAFAQEPTAYPTGFSAATQSGTSITLNWIGSLGANLPSDYVILVRALPSGTFTAVADNSAIANDNDLTDNAGAQNVTHAVGANTYTWTGLPLNTDFEFTIYPYKTGGATNPDFKTSPAAPTATASTKVPTVTSPTATGVNEVDATLGGTVTSNGGNALTERGTVWKTSAGVTIADNKQSEGGTTVSTFTHARTVLPSGTRIFYAAYATNVAGSALSSESSFYTYSTLPGGQPASVTATAVSSTQINLTFSAFSTLTNTNGYVILRRVGSGPSTASVQDGVAPTSLALGASTYVTTITNSGTTSFNDTGLSAGTDYYYSVIPFNWNTTNSETYNYRTSGGFTTDNDVTFSGTSDITFTGGTTASISYKNYQSGSIADNQSNSLTLGDFTIRDGGGSADPDTKTTIVNSITVQIANFANVRSIALFNDDTDTEIPGTEQTVSGTNVTFTPTTPITVADDGTFNINVRATFQQTVTDKQTIHITITGVSAGAAGSGFASANAGGASTTTAGTTNQINVTASKLVFQANPPTTPISTNFSLTVRALDSNPYNNLDLDYTGQIDLTGSGGSGVLSSGAQPLNPSLVAGQYTWTQLQFNLAGTYTLDAFDDLHGDVLNDATGTVVISSAGVNITKPATLNLCYGGSFQTLGNIVITEADPGDFANNGTSSFSLALPTGFIFDQTVTTAPVVGGGSDISAPTTLSYPGENVVQFSYNISGTSNINTITISGLKIRYPGSTAPASTSITRIGGTATIAGDPVGTQHGTVTAALGTPPPGLGFTVSGDALVNPNETRFNQSSNAIQLDGSPATPGVGVFTGSGVTFTGGKYKFNPSSLSPGNYTITYTYTDASAQQCSFTFSKTFEVYVTNISGLQTKYCDNDAQSPALSVSPVYITTRYGAGYTFQKFVYYNYASFTPVDLTTPAANVFDPKLYESIYIATQTYTGIYGIYIGFTVSNGLFTSTEWQFVTIKKAQKPNFSMPKTFFCADEPPVVLTGDPANSNSTGTDFFTASAGKQTSISSGGTPTVWTFNPASVSGVTTATPVNFNITYTYQDPATLCSSTSDPQVITVSARPSIVPTGNISPGTTIELCQGTTVSSFTASSIPGTTYSWYSNNPPTNQVGIGNSFLPPVSNLIAGTSNFYVTRTINGCESTQAPLSLAVVVNASPGAPVSDFSREYCVNQAIPNSDLVVTGSNVKWYDATDALIYSGSNPSAANLGINNTVAAIYSFTATQTVNSCEGARTKITITVKPLPGLDIIASIPDVNRICVTGGFVTFEARDQGLTAPNGSWSGSGGIGSALVPNPGAGTVQLNPSLLSPGGYNLHLVYQNPSTTCSNTQDLAITILPTINPSISIGTACNGFPVSITNNSTMVPGSSTSTIASTGWTFGDGTSLVAGDGNVPAGTNLGKTTGTYFSPNHIFGGLGNFLIQYTMTTSDGCVVTPAPIPVTINPNPNSTFTWEKVCYDAVTGSNTSFFANTSNIADANIQSYTWNFAKANQLTIGTSGVGKNPTVNYTSVGVDSVQLIVTTIANCKDTVQKPVFIVPAYPAITETNSYSQDFDAGTDGWIAGGIKSSWAYGKPSGAVINKDASAGGGGNAWDTNLTGNSNSNEQSWVLSQCYDFTQAQKPIISLDIWSDTPSGNDGAVLQYNENGNIENDANWIVIGQIGQGANWYDESGISSSPGNQSANDLGWTGIYGGWRRAIFKLDNLIGKPNVVFRVAFASNIPRREGFAFDNVFIGERTRTVLVESFTNTSAAANTKLHNDAFSAFSSNSTEVAKIEFHTAFPGEDPLNKANVEINNSRTAFYGITNTSMFSLDGSVVNNVAGLTQLYNDRVLTPSAVRINTVLVKDGELVRIQTSITNATNQTIPTAGINLFTAIVEKSITEASMLGSNGDTELSFVAKEMLPTAAGIKLTEDIAPLGTIALPEVVWNNRNLITSGNGAIVVFLQSIEGGNKNVYQAKILDATVEPDLVTGIEHGYAAEVNVYPNPTQGLLNIQLPQPASQALPVSLLDGFGREVYTSQFKNGENTKVISTSEFAGGIYILQLKSAKGEVVRKKIIVANKQ